MYLERGGDYFLPNLSIDLVIIGYQEDNLKCLLLQIGEKWLLPGGYIRMDDSVDETVQKILKNRTGLEDPHFKFLSVFGGADRKFTDEWKAFIEASGTRWSDDYWINTRFVTLTYYSLVNIENTHPTVSHFDQAYDWFNFDDLPDMWMDHKAIAREARNRIKEDIKQEQIVYNLLPPQFTMPELHQLYQTVLEEELDRSRFQKKMLASGHFERLPKRKKEAPGRNPYEYTIRREEN